MNKRILLCDDEFHIVRAAEIKFQRRGFDVRTASDGEEAWEILQEWLPDVLVTDCQMPRLDGLGLVRRLRDHDAMDDLPVLMLTAKSFEKQYRDTADELGILGVIPKPFSPRELLIRVEQIVELQPSNSQSQESIATDALPAEAAAASETSSAQTAKA